MYMYSTCPVDTVHRGIDKVPSQLFREHKSS